MRFLFGRMTAILIGAQLFIAVPAGSQTIDYRSVIRDAGEILFRGTGQPPGQPSQPYPGDVTRPPPGGTLVANLEADPASVLEAQTHLNALGYEPGVPDGVLGGDTRRALQRFQRVMSLPATGELSASTMSALRAAARSQGQPPQRPAAQPQPQPAARAGATPSAGVPAAGYVAQPGINGVRAIAPVMQGGRLLTGFPVLHGRFNKEQVEIGPHRRHYVKSSFDLALYMDLFVLKHWPDALKRQDYAYDYANRFLTGGLLARYVSGCQYNCSTGIPFDGWAGRNEFEREESYQAFVRDAPALLGSLAPDAPVEALLVLEVQVQPYDSKVSAFPINVVRPALSLFGTVSPASRASTVAEFEVPSRVTLSRAEAPAFLDQLPAQRRIAYLGLVVSVGKPDWNPQRASATMAMTLKTAKLYLDPDLQRQIHDFDAATASTAASQAASAAPPDQLPVVRNPGDGRLASLANDLESVTRSLLVAGWRGKPEIASNEHVLLNLARSLLPERERTALVNQNYGRWAGVDEFARERSRQEFLTKWQPLLFAQVPQLPLRFSVVSLSELGDYDIGNQRFPFKWIGFHGGDREPRTIVLSMHTLYGGHRINLDKAPPSFLPMSRSDAEAFLQRRREAIAADVRRNRQSSPNTAGLERLVVFRAEIEVDGFTPDASRSQETFTWSGRVRRMELFEDVSLRRSLLDNAAIAAADPARALEAARDAKLVPPPDLSLAGSWAWDDTSLLIAAKAAPARLTPQAWQYAARQTLQAERTGDRNVARPWGRFFSDDFIARQSGDLAAEHVGAFRDWTLRRAAAMPPILWIPIRLAPTSHVAGTPVRRLELSGELQRNDANSLHTVKLQVDNQQSIHFRLPSERLRYRVEVPSSDYDRLGSNHLTWLRGRVTEYAASANGPVLVIEPELVVLVRSNATSHLAEPRVEQRVLFGDTTAETQAKAVASAAADQAAKAAEAAKKLTIVGMAPGMTLADARRIASAHLGADVRAYVPELDRMETPASRLLDASILLENASGTERISLLASRRRQEPVVVAIRRQITLAPGAGPTPEEVFAQATGQYGRPDGSAQQATWRGASSGLPATCVATRLQGTADDFVWRREQTPKFTEPRYLRSKFMTGESLQANHCGIQLRMENRFDANARHGTRLLIFETEDVGLAVNLLTLPVPPVQARPTALGFAKHDPRTPRDVLQIVPGMTLAEADTLAKAHLPKAMRLVADGTNPVAPEKHPQLASGLLLADPARKESITLFTERDGDTPRVVAVMRHVVVPKDSTAAIVADAIKKYGEPGARTERGVWWGVKPHATDGYFSSCIQINLTTVGPWRHGSIWKAAPGTTISMDMPTTDFLGTVPAMRVDSLNPDSRQQGSRYLIDCPAQSGVMFMPASAESIVVVQWTIDTGGTAELLDRMRAGAATAPSGAPRGAPGQAPSGPPAAPAIKL